MVKRCFCQISSWWFEKGGIAGGIWVIYSETDFDIQQAYDSAIHAFKPYEKNLMFYMG